jgi:hypothetical protein
MMPLSPEDELKELNKRLLQVNVVDTPGIIALALGLFAKFSDDPGSLHPAFEDPAVSTGLVVLGGTIAIWGLYQVISIVRRRSEVQSKLNT